MSGSEQPERLAGLYIDPDDGDQLLYLHAHDSKLLGGAATREQAHELTEVKDDRFRYVLFPSTEFVVNEDRTLTTLVDGRPVNCFVGLEPYSHSREELRSSSALTIARRRPTPTKWFLMKAASPQRH